MHTRITTRLATATGLAMFAIVGSSCTTYYDSYGYPRQAVDPGLAVAGVLAAGALGYAIADSNDHHHHYRGHHYSPPRRYYHDYRYRRDRYCY